MEGTNRSFDQMERDQTVSEEEIEKCDDSRYDALTVADLETLEIMTE